MDCADTVLDTGLTYWSETGVDKPTRSRPKILRHLEIQSAGLLKPLFGYDAAGASKVLGIERFLHDIHPAQRVPKTCGQGALPIVQCRAAILVRTTGSRPYTGRLIGRGGYRYLDEVARGTEKEGPGEIGCCVVDDHRVLVGVRRTLYVSLEFRVADAELFLCGREFPPHGAHQIFLREPLRHGSTRQGSVRKREVRKKLYFTEGLGVLSCK